MNDERALAYAILNYLTEQPKAKDTFQGIAGWWLFKEHMNRSVNRISGALDSLITKGFVVVNEYPDQEKYYQLNEDKLPEIREILQRNLTR